MKSIPAVVLALLLLPLPQSPAPPPEPAPTVMSAPPSPTEASTASNPGTQMMGVGELDVVLEGTGERQVVVEADFAEVGDRLFMINGVTVRENIPSELFDLFIEDAIQEVATAVAGVSVRPGVEADPGEDGDRGTGTLSGTVVDGQGNPLPGAVVTVRGIESEVDQITNESGEFRVDGLPPGQHTVFVELEGLSRVEHPDVVIRGGTETTVDVTLSPAVVAEEIVVSGVRSPISEAAIETGVTITMIELEELPIARDHWGAIALTPGLNSDGINVGGNEPRQQDVPTDPLTTEELDHLFVVNGVILTDRTSSLSYEIVDDWLEEQVRGQPPLPVPGPRGSGRDLGVTSNTGPDFPPSSDVTINAITRGGRNNTFTNGRFFGDRPGDHPADWIDPAHWDQVQIDIGQRPDGTSCLERIGATDADGNPLPSADALDPGAWIGAVVDPPVPVTLGGWKGQAGTRFVELPDCDGEGSTMFAVDLGPWDPFLLTTEDAPTAEEVTFRLADGTAGVDVTLFDRDGPRSLGTTGVGGISRVPAGDVEDGTALIAYAVGCGEDKQIVLVRPEDEDAFLEAYGDCAGRRLERFAWYAGDVFVDVRGLARWIPSASEALQPQADPAEVGDRQTGTLSGTVVDRQGKPLPGALVTATGIGSPAVQITNASGEFRFYDVPPGEMRLTAELEGFSTVAYPDISIGTRTNTTLEVTLSPALEEVIAVTTESPLLDQRKITTGATINEIELDRIPTARDPWDVIRQTPGVISDRINAGGNESGQQDAFTNPGTADDENSFAVDGVIITDMAAIGPSPSRDDIDPLEEPEAATGGIDVEHTSKLGLTIDAVTPLESGGWRMSGRYFAADRADRGAMGIDIGQQPDGTSCLEGFGRTDADGRRLPDPQTLQTTWYTGVLTQSLYVTVQYSEKIFELGRDPGTWLVELPACGDNGRRLFAFDFDRWIRSLLTTEGDTEGGPADPPATPAETRDVPTGDQVTFLLADGTAGVDVTLFDRGEPRRLGTTGEAGVARVPAEEVEDGTALIAYAVGCGEDKQIVLVRPGDEEAFLDAYGDCGGRRLERFAWFAGDVFVDVRGLARWIPYPQAPQPADDLGQVPGDEDGVDAALPGTSMAPPHVAGGAALLLPDASIDPVNYPEALSGPSGPPGSASNIRVVIRSTGGSTGPVVEAYLVNHGYEPVRIRAEGLVLEPVTEEELDPAARARMQEILDAASSGKPVAPPQAGTEAREARVVRVELDAYCLEFAKDVPVEGTLFRIVGREAQQGAAGFREIIRASRRLQDTSALHPDGDPESYFHSTRQWAAWADELELDRDGFQEAFVEHARKNFDAAGRPWTTDVEEQVRALVPNRWADLRAVLDEADRSPGRIR